MLPSMEPRPSKPIKTTPHLVVKVNEGWQYDDNASEFVSEVGERVSTEPVLPAESRVVRRVPQFAVSPKSDAERDLARYFNVLLPGRSDPTRLAGMLRKLKCIERVDLPPEVGLPETAG